MPISETLIHNQFQQYQAWLEDLWINYIVFYTEHKKDPPPKKKKSL